MSASDQYQFLTKLSKELERDSEEYRASVANKQTHHFTITHGMLSKAINALVDKYFPDADRASKKRVFVKVQKPMKTFITNVGNKVKARAKTSKGIHTIKTSSTKVSAVFQASGGNRYEKAYNMYGREEKFVKPFTDSILDILEEEFGVRPKKEKDGKSKEIKPGDVFNLEHKHTRGIVESLIRDSIDNAAKDSEKFGVKEVQEFCKNFDIDFKIIRDTATDTMEVFVGSKIINLEEGDYSKKEKSKLEEAVRKAIVKLEETGNVISFLPGSPSFAEIKELQGVNRVLGEFRKRKNAIVDSDETINYAKTKTKNKFKGVRAAPSPLKKKKIPRRAGTKRKASPAAVPLQLIASLNKRLPDTVQKNMKPPALEYDTGRFAESVKVTDVMTTPKGFPSVGYTYDRENYGQFEATSGSAQFASHDRDPRRLIDQSIREIASKMAIGRFFTRRV